MSTLTIPHSFSGSTTALSAQVNANFTAVAAVINGQLDQTNLTTLTGLVTWSVSSNVLAQNISSNSTAGLVVLTSTGVLAAAKSVLKIVSAAAQTTGDAGLYISFSSASTTIPAALIEQSGTGKVLKVVSTTGAAIPAPVQTTAQRDAMTGAAGDMVYNSTNKRHESHDGVAWRGAGNSKVIVSKTTTYTATGAEDVILCDTSGGAWSLTLPAAASHKGHQYKILKTTSDTNALTVDGNASETIQGATTRLLCNQNACLSIVSDGSNWLVAGVLEAVSARAKSNAGQTVNNTSQTTLIFEDEDWDSHDCHDVSTGVFTVKTAGVYEVKCFISLGNSAQWNGTEYASLLLQKNGADELEIAYWMCQSAGTLQPRLGGSGLVKCAVGDTINVQLYQQSGASQSLDGTAGRNWISIAKVGEV